MEYLELRDKFLLQLLSIGHFLYLLVIFYIYWSFSIVHFLYRPICHYHTLSIKSWQLKTLHGFLNKKLDYKKIYYKKISFTEQTLSIQHVVTLSSMANLSIIDLVTLYLLRIFQLLYFIYKSNLKKIITEKNPKKTIYLNLLLLN